MVQDGAWSVWGDAGWYMVILGQYNLVLLGIKWYWVCKMLYCLYILKKQRFGRVLPIPDIQTTEYRATQLVYSIKFKLSHATLFLGP